MKPDQLTAHADGKLLAGVVDRVGHVVINNPERHNAISLDMYRAGAAEVAVHVAAAAELAAGVGYLS